ncbi:MAG: hypothetical protein ACK5Z2_19755 [Bacteroidota bacterium]|jgi:hypothetical protein
MKSSIKTLFLVLVIAMFSSFSSLSANTFNVLGQKSEIENCGVNDQQVINYMAEQGLQVLSITPMTGTCDKIVSVMGGKKFHLYVEGNQIVGWEEMHI